jgi:hypothetical protein
MHFGKLNAALQLLVAALAELRYGNKHGFFPIRCCVVSMVQLVGVLLLLTGCRAAAANCRLLPGGLSSALLNQPLHSILAFQYVVGVLLWLRLPNSLQCVDSLWAHRGVGAQEICLLLTVISS